MSLTDQLSVVCDYLYELLTSNKGELGLADVFYGDQEKLPQTPAACVEPDEMMRELKSAQRMTRVTHRVYIVIYSGAVTSPQFNRRDADTLAERIEMLIHSKQTLDGLLIHGMCTGISSGYISKQRTLVRASRITYEGLSQMLLPSTG